MTSEGFSIGNVVTWRSQAQGTAKTKVGTIIEVVPPDTRPSTEGRPGSMNVDMDGIMSAILLRSRPGSRSRARGTTGLW